MPSAPLSEDGVDLYWLPLGAGAGGRVVRASGRIYEALAARLQHRARVALFHSALIVRVDGHQHAIEMAPVWALQDTPRGVVSEGPVGSPVWGRSRLFRYEIRCWRDGHLPDAPFAVGGPQRLSTARAQARRVVELVASCPVATWGRDELHAGEMWNSNSLISWLLVCSGHDIASVRPPLGGRAPGWTAGAVVAHRGLPHPCVG